jgi:hypothetical protein
LSLGIREAEPRLEDRRSDSPLMERPNGNLLEPEGAEERMDRQPF